jgi:high affinity sulfate transporter 1
MSKLTARAERYAPILKWLPGLTWRRARPDLVAGIVVAALAIPQALGYAAVAGVPVQVGLYTLPPALLAYAVFGSSRLLIVGPVSTVSLLSGSLVAQMAHGDTARAVALTSIIAIFAGLSLIVAGLLRVGWVAEFLSEPIVTGFVSGLTVLVMWGLLPQLVGSPAIFSYLAISWPTLAVTAIGLTVIFGGHKIWKAAPWSLIVLMGGVAVSYLLNLQAHGVAVIGQISISLKGMAIPSISASDLPSLLTGGVAIGMVGLAEGLAAARLYARKQRAHLDSNQELLAAGAANVASGLFGGMGVAGSLSKTAAADRAGARSQVAGITAAVVSMAALLVAAPFIALIPKAILAVVVVHAVWNLLKPGLFWTYHKIRPNDFYAALFAFVGVLVLGPLNGLLLAIGQSLLGLIYRSGQVKVDVMGKIPGEKAAWGSVHHHPERVIADGVLLLRLNSPLFWVNATQAVERILAITASHHGIKAVVLDLKATNQLDATAARQLELLLTALRARGKDLQIALVFDQARRVLYRSGFVDLIGSDHIWHSISAAVKAAKAETADER